MDNDDPPAKDSPEARRREPHVQLVRGNYFYKAEKAMRAAGIHSEPLGPDLARANERAVVLNRLWADIRTLEQAVTPTDSVGALFDDFTKDEVWYKSLKRTTQVQIDLAFTRLRGFKASDTAPAFGSVKVRAIRRQHGRALYNGLLRLYTLAEANKCMKWFQRALNYAVETGAIEYNPCAGMKVRQEQRRQVVWTPSEVERAIGAALTGGTADSGNQIPPRPSIALAIAIAYDTTLPQSDILRLQRSQWDGTGFTVAQFKERGQARVYVVPGPETRAMIQATLEASEALYLIVSEETGRPFLDDPNSSTHSQRTSFGRLAAKFAKRAGVTGKTFHDLRRSGASAFGNTGATDTELVTMGGWRHGSSELKTYIVPDKAAALRAAMKRWGEDAFKDDLQPISNVSNKK